MSLVESRSIGDPLAALFNRKGIDEEVRRADQPLLHSGRRLDGQQFVHQDFIKALAKLGQGFGQDKMLRSAVPLDSFDATGVHDGQVRAPAVTDGVVGSAYLRFEQLQRQQHPGRDRETPTGGVFGKALGKAAVDSGYAGCPGQGLGPLPQGMGVWHEISNLEVRTGASQPILEVAEEPPRQLS